MSTDLMAVIGGITAVVAALGAVGAAGRWAWRVLDRLDDLRDDWRGRPARPGVPAQPGVLERLAVQETRLAEIRAELHPNGGGSIRDAVDRTERRVMAVEAQVGDHLAEHARQDAYRLQVTQDRTTLEHGHLGGNHP